MTKKKEPTLNEALRERGLSTTPSRWPLQKRVLDAEGREVFDGTANQVWRWLRGEEGEQ